MLENFDTGLIPEAMMIENTGTLSPFQWIRQPSVPYSKIYEAASISSLGDERNFPAIMEYLSDTEPAVRYWGATACVILGKKAAGARSELIKALKDPSVNVRIAAAEAVYNLGEKQKALDVLLEAVSNPVKMARVHAFNVLDIIGKNASVLVPGVEKIYKGLINDQPTVEYDVRSARYFLSKYKPVK
jgi:hypothetical protein